MAERDAEGGARSFPSHKDITASGFLVLLSEGVGEASVTFQGDGRSRQKRAPEELFADRLFKHTNADGELNIASYPFLSG